MNQPESQLAKVEKSIIAAGTKGVMLSSMEDMYRFATCVVNSGLAPKSFSTPEQVVLAVQFGAEIGLSPMQALQNECVINGKVGVYGEASLAICMRDSSYEDHEEWFEVDKKRIDEEDVITAITAKKNVVAFTEMKAKGRIPVKRAFSVADAVKAGLWAKAGPWVNYPQRMLRFKARHWAEKDCFPNALKGIPLAEDLISEYGGQPKQIKAREVATGLVLPDEPTHADIDQKISENAAKEAVEAQSKLEPSDNDGTDVADFTKGEELFK